MDTRPDHVAVTPEEFFRWIVGQEARYELVEGEVVMMAGAGRRHDAIVVNLTTTIHAQTRGGPCQTFTGDTYVATSASTRRMPDLGGDCGKPTGRLAYGRPALSRGGSAVSDDWRLRCDGQARGVSGASHSGLHPVRGYREPERPSLRQGQRPSLAGRSCSRD